MLVHQGVTFRHPVLGGLSAVRGTAAFAPKHGAAPTTRKAAVWGWPWRFSNLVIFVMGISPQNS